MTLSITVPLVAVVSMAMPPLPVGVKFFEVRPSSTAQTLVVLWPMALAQLCVARLSTT